MKTLLETIKCFSKKDLIDAYIKREDLKFMNLPKSWKHIKKIPYKKLRKAHLRSVSVFIDELLAMPAKKVKEGEKCIIFGFPHVGTDEPMHELVRVKEMKEYGEKANGYSYILTDWEEMMSTLIADTRYTRDNLSEIIGQIIWEMSFYGFTNKDVKQVRDELYDMVKELDEKSDKRRTGKRENVMDTENSSGTEKKGNGKTLKLKSLEKLKNQYKEARDAYQNGVRAKELKEVMKSLEIKI